MISLVSGNTHERARHARMRAHRDTLGNSIEMTCLLHSPEKGGGDLESIFEKMKAAKKLQMAPLLHNIKMWRDKTSEVSLYVAPEHSFPLPLFYRTSASKSIFPASLLLPLSGEQNNL